MSIETDARQEAERIEQSNAIAHTVIEVARNKTPREFVTLDFRYGIADALWDAGYRKVAQETQEPSDAEVLAALNARELSVRERSGSARYFNPAPDLSIFDKGTIADTRAALIAAQEVRDVS